MRQLLCGLLAILITSCALVDIRAMNASNLLKLRIGMSRDEALYIMGTKVYETYENTGGSSCCFFRMGSVNITNPYRTEIKRVGNKSYEILLYYTDIKKHDGAITDDELTPLVFDGGKLLGWGWSFFEDTAQKYELKVKER